MNAFHRYAMKVDLSLLHRLSLAASNTKIQYETTFNGEQREVCMMEYLTGKALLVADQAVEKRDCHFI